MHLADHIRPLLRDHDCVIIPDFGGLVADVSPARAQPGRQALSPPTKLVAFNQALTRNDGLLVDALSQHLGISIAQARDAVRTAVASLQQELDDTNRTELAGIGIFRRAAGRGLAFEYTGTDNLLASSFGLPELTARPVRTADVRAKRPQPALRGAGARRTRLARLLPGGLVALAVGLMLLANYQVAMKAGYLPASWQTRLPQLSWAAPAAGPSLNEPQQATLGQHDFSNASPVNSNTAPVASEGMTPVAATPAATVPEMATAVAPTTAPTVAPVAVEPIAPTPATEIKTAAPATAVAERSTTAAPAANVTVAKAPAKPVFATTIKSRTGRYYVVADAYSNLAGAEQRRKELARAGHPAQVILPPYGSRLFRVTTSDYSDLASAQREARRLRVSTHRDYNTLKF